MFLLAVIYKPTSINTFQLMINSTAGLSDVLIKSEASWVGIPPAQLANSVSEIQYSIKNASVEYSKYLERDEERDIEEETFGMWLDYSVI